MLGSIVGDIAGSIYEFDNIRTKNFPLFGEGCTFTDDTIMALAVAKSLLEIGDNRDEATVKAAFVRNMQAFGRAYPSPMGGYGASFGQWLRSRNPQPYNSWGNGSAMRVAACGFAAHSVEDARELARMSAEVTHNHPEAVAGAQITATCIFMAKNNCSQRAIAMHVEQTYCKLGKSIDELRETYSFTERCRDTVPQAIQAFVEATSFEDAIRNAVSIGGDSDTLAAITGGIAEAFFHVPNRIRSQARRFLTKDLLLVVDDFEDAYQK